MPAFHSRPSTSMAASSATTPSILPGAIEHGHIPSHEDVFDKFGVTTKDEFRAHRLRGHRKVPLRAPNAFFLFRRDHSLKGMNGPYRGGVEISRGAAEAWKALAPVPKEYYTALAKAVKELYKELWPDFSYKSEGIEQTQGRNSPPHVPKETVQPSSNLTPPYVYSPHSVLTDNTSPAVSPFPLTLGGCNTFPVIHSPQIYTEVPSELIMIQYRTTAPFLAYPGITSPVPGNTFNPTYPDARTMNDPRNWMTRFPCQISNMGPLGNVFINQEDDNASFLAEFQHLNTFEDIMIPSYEANTRKPPEVILPDAFFS